jgi:1-acyl-sn-glycerol-3-phosphate acyltransferase
LDPIFVGLACDRLLSYVARQTLFRSPIFGRFIASLGAFPIDRDGTGLGGLKEMLKRLKQGEVVLVFPEGTRSPDGEIQTIRPGFCAVARRAGVPLVPVAVDGTFDAWSRRQRLPRRAVVHLQFGPPIEPAEIESMTDEQLVAEVERRIRACHAEARRGRNSATGRAALTGPAGRS